ncbi:MAG: ABC transporter substrate-binding protein [Clostridium sp.]|uniref:ABC transporter substrate-binding protein n=1 Tax=Clostridium sp. TaxID=1506 RepID=UPI00303327C9
MLKKSLAITLALTLAMVGLVGCGSKGSGSGEGASNKDGKKELVISTFGLNEDKMWENLFTPFEKEYGVKIVLETGNNSERLTKLENNPNSNVDLIVLAQSFSQEGIDADLFEKLDYSKIPNSEKLNDKAKVSVKSGFGPAQSQNSIALIVNTTAGIEVNTWEDLWKPELKGKIAIPDIATTNGPAMVQIAAKKAGVDIATDKGEAAFKELEALKPNIVKTYSKSSDLANMFASGEIIAAVGPDFAYGNIVKACPEAKYIVPESGTYLNFNTINMNKNSKNKDLAYDFLNFALSAETQTRTAKGYQEAPTNAEVKLTEEEAKNLTYGPMVDNAHTIDFKVVNPLMTEWIDKWNRLMN